MRIWRFDGPVDCLDLSFDLSYFYYPKLIGVVDSLDVAHGVQSKLYEFPDLLVFLPVMFFLKSGLIGGGNN